MGYRFCSYCFRPYPVVNVAEVEEACNKLQKVLDDVGEGKKYVDEAKTICTRDVLHFGDGPDSDMQAKLTELSTDAENEINEGNNLKSEIIDFANKKHEAQVKALKDHEDGCPLNPKNIEQFVESWTKKGDK